MPIYIFFHSSALLTLRKGLNPLPTNAPFQGFNPIPAFRHSSILPFRRSAIPPFCPFPT